VVEDVLLRVHVPLDLVDFVGSVRTVIGHHNRTFKLSIDEVSVESVSAVLDESQAMVNRQELGDVVDDQVQASLKDPRAGKEARPGLNLVLELLGLQRHEETRVATDLSQSRVSKTVLDDAVDETEGDWMVLHF